MKKIDVYTSWIPWLLPPYIIDANEIESRAIGMQRQLRRVGLI